MNDDDEDYDPEELYQETEIEEMREWLEVCESTASASNSSLSKWEVDFVESVREQFNDKIAEGRKKPLSGKQLATLRKIYDQS